MAIVPSSGSGADAGLAGMLALSVVARTAGGPLAVAPAVRHAVPDLDRALPFFNLRQMEAVMAQWYARLTFTLLALVVPRGSPWSWVRWVVWGRGIRRHAAH